MMYQIPAQAGPSPVGAAPEQDESACARLVRLAARVQRVPVAGICLAGVGPHENCTLASFTAGANDNPYIEALLRVVCQHVCDSGQPVVIQDVRAHPLTASATTGPPGLVAVAAVPLRPTEGRVSGMLYVMDRCPRVWSAAEIAVLEDLAALAVTELMLHAIAKEHDQLVERERRRAERMQQLAATLARVAACSEWESALRELLIGAINVLDGDYGVVQMFGPNPGERSLMLRVGRDGTIVERETASPFPPGSFAAALQAGSPAMLVEDFWALQPEQYSLRDKLQQQGVRSAVIVPIEAGGQRIGSLHVNHHLPGFFGPAELSLAETLAAQAGAAIERARLTTARQQAEAARAAAETAREQLQEFMALVSHELRNPLAVLLGYVQLLRRPELLRKPEGRLRALDALDDAARRMRRLLDDLSDAARIGAGHFAIQPIHMDLVAAARRVVEHEQRAGPGPHVVLAAPERLEGEWDRERIEQLLVNLVRNARKYSPSESTVNVVIERCGEAARIHVVDQGIGIAREAIPQLFQPFTRLATTRYVYGLGLGLYICKAIVDAHGGRIWVESTIGCGSTFIVELPVRST